MTIARLAAVGVVLALAAPARAQSAEAEVLFREGKRLMKEGQTAAACDKFDASARVESSAGTLLNAADCREKNHQLATAWGTFLRAASAAKTAGDPKREAEARRRAGALEKRLAYLTIIVPDDAKDGLVVKRNAVAVDVGLWGQPVPVDAGSYAVVAEAPGRARFEATVAITAEGQRETIEVKRGDAAATVVVPPPSTVTPHVDDSRPTPPPHVEAAPSRFTTMRKVALVTTIVGAGGIAIGTVFGLEANSEHDDANKICPGTACGSPEAVDKNKSAQDHALIANIGLIGGGALVATGVVLFLVGGPSSREGGVSVAPRVTRDQVGLSLGGSF